MLTVLCLNILSEGITDAMVAAPTAPIEQNENEKDLKREEDRILVDPVAAYAAQASKRSRPRSWPSRRPRRSAPTA